MLGFLKYKRLCVELIKEYRPDIIITFSDSIYAILGQHLAIKFRIKCVVDMYDHFEAFDSAKIPGVVHVYKRAVRKSHAVTTASSLLAKYVQHNYPPKGPVETFINGTPKNIFFPLNKNQCRKEYQMEENALVIGYAGAISKDRGIKILFDAFLQLTTKYPNLRLVLAGTKDSHTNIPKHPSITYFKTIPYQQINSFINTFDISVICNTNNILGHYAFPGKVFKMLACGVTVISSDIDSMKKIFKDYPECVYKRDDLKSLISVLQKQIENPTKQNIPILSWSDIGNQYHAFLKNLFAQDSRLA